VAQLAQETYNANVLPLLVKNLGKLEFESKKDVALIFNNLLRRQIGTRSPTVEYLCARPEILLALVKGLVFWLANWLLLISYSYESQDIALTCGTMLKECIRHEHLAKIILYSEQFYDFFGYAELSTFDIASDALSTFKVRGRLVIFDFNKIPLVFSSTNTKKVAKEIGFGLETWTFKT
jgi:calcium binding protein 39